MADSRIADLIRQSYSDADAEKYLAFESGEEHVGHLATVGKEVLDRFPTMPARCVVMSALYAALLQTTMPDASIHVVAGLLHADDVCVFGKDAPTDWAASLGATNMDWDGHCWVICGDRIADISFFRTAYSSGSPPALTSLVLREFGKGKGLMIARSLPNGLRYEPQYVLTDQQITRFTQTAMAIVQEGQMAPGGD